MLRPRIIPCLLLYGTTLIKTRNFQDPQYIGDPINTVHMFNELEVDELIVLDITPSSIRPKPNWNILEKIAHACTRPLTIGGGISTIDDIARLMQLGTEKVSLNSAALQRPAFIAEAAQKFGSQAITVSIDSEHRNGTYGVRGSAPHLDPVQWAQHVEAAGAGEILLTSVEREGVMKGYDLELIRQICTAIQIPVIAHGGAGSILHVQEAIAAGASAAAVGSMVVFARRNEGVLVHIPAERTLVWPGR